MVRYFSPTLVSLHRTCAIIKRHALPSKCLQSMCATKWNLRLTQCQYRGKSLDSFLSSSVRPNHCGQVPRRLHLAEGVVLHTAATSTHPSPDHDHLTVCAGGCIATHHCLSAKQTRCEVTRTLRLAAVCAPRVVQRLRTSPSTRLSALCAPTSPRPLSGFQ